PGRQGGSSEKWAKGPARTGCPAGRIAHLLGRQVVAEGNKPAQHNRGGGGAVPRIRHFGEVTGRRCLFGPCPPLVGSAAAAMGGGPTPRPSLRANWLTGGRGPDRAGAPLPIKATTRPAIGR